MCLVIPLVVWWVNAVAVAESVAQPKISQQTSDKHPQTGDQMTNTPVKGKRNSICRSFGHKPSNFFPAVARLLTRLRPRERCPSTKPRNLVDVGAAGCLLLL